MTLIPVSHAVGGSASSRRTTGLVVTVQGPNVHSGFPAIDNGSFAIGNPVSPAAIARQGTIIIMYVSGPLNRAVVIVPDGVTRVQLSQFVPDRSSGGRLAAIAPASASVHDNVALIPLPDVTTTALHQTQQTVRGDGGLFSSHHCRVNAVLYFVPVSARMTWWRTTATGSETHATTVRTSLNGYSTTLLHPHHADAPGTDDLAGREIGTDSSPLASQALSATAGIRAGPPGTEVASIRQS